MPRPSRHVVVSPHFDDAALSCGHVLLGPAEHVTLVTVCAAAPPDGTPVSDWDLTCGFATGADAARVRAAEDDAACARVGAVAVRLPFPDGAYGGPPDGGRLRAAVGELLPDAATLWLPAAIGGHPDHRATRDALLPLVAVCAASRLYADSPYAAGAGWDASDAERPAAGRWAEALGAVAAAGVRVGDEQRVRLEGAGLDGKHALVRSHASQLAQLGAVFPGFGHRHGPLATEVSWALRSGSRRRPSLPFRR